MQIYLITHAHTEQIAGVAADAWRLSRRGDEEARTLARAAFWQHIDQIVVSSEPKTWLTIAEVAAARNLPVWIDSRFDELRRAGWSADYAVQVVAAFAAPDQSIGEWESISSVRRRALGGLAALQRLFGHQRVALVGHGLCLSILRAEFLSAPRVDFDAWQRLNFGSYAVVEADPYRLIADFPRAAGVTR